MKDYYHLRHKRVAKRSVEASPHHHATLSQEPQVGQLDYSFVQTCLNNTSVCFRVVFLGCTPA